MNAESTAFSPIRKRKERYRHGLYLLCVILLGLMVLLISRAVITRAGEEARWPSEGGWVDWNGMLILDESNLSQGYVMARVSDYTSQRLKLRVTYGGSHLDYDLPGNCEYAVIPLQMGSGSYQVQLYQNVSGKKYAEVGCLWIYAELEREDVAFLYPNQYVDYSVVSAAVAEADALCAGKSDQEVYSTICSYMRSGFVYDFIKAITITAGQLPDIDGSFEKRMGVCQDLSAIMCCMLRTQGIPARLVIGYADNSYHAWTVTEVDGEEKFYDPTVEIGALGRVRTYSAERWY